MKINKQKWGMSRNRSEIANIDYLIKYFNEIDIVAKILSKLKLSFIAKYWKIDQKMRGCQKYRYVSFRNVWSP